jgi:hypothetical protein
VMKDSKRFFFRAFCLYDDYEFGDHIWCADVLPHVANIASFSNNISWIVPIPTDVTMQTGKVFHHSCGLLLS